MSLTTYHAKQFAYDLTRRAASGMDRLSMALEITAVRLLYKSGGKCGVWKHPDGLVPEVEEMVRSFGE